MKRNVQIEIAGARYRMSSDADEAYLQRLADIVNERVAALGPKAARAATPAQLLAVVAVAVNAIRGTPGNHSASSPSCR